ncbi:hypothetical protein [Chromatium okenii]|jgi:hypothetical protein|uniref:Uncharacterized protein n=1 Tax=Chromatium okenii TaxID=61644 RepID=A0A2S7XV90_9GAMM|nr:hypothetical protein [Chromatium okenii]PQJ97388.1 hypothetical protein CXB77_02370 [Chromatium okenii]
MADPKTPVAEIDDRQRQRLRLARLETDMAYFQARLELIGDSHSSYRVTQRKVFHLLNKSVVYKIQKIKQRYAELR